MTLKIYNIIELTLFYFNIKDIFSKKKETEEVINLNLSWEKYKKVLEGPYFSPIKKQHQYLIDILKEKKKTLEISTDRRLITSLIQLLLMVRREGNKKKNYQEVLNSNISELKNHPEFSKSRLLKDKKLVNIKFPKKKI